MPGVSGGEGCSTAGGCASCPFMKMNDLDSLVDVVAPRGRGAGRHDIGLDALAHEDIARGMLVKRRNVYNTTTSTTSKCLSEGL